MSEHESLALTRLNISAPSSCNEALYSPMIVAVGLLGPLTRSDNPSQAAWPLGTCQTSMMCCQKVRPDCFSSDPEILTLNQVDISAPSWYEALYSPMIVAVGTLGPSPRSLTTLYKLLSKHEHVRHQ